MKQKSLLGLSVLGLLICLKLIVVKVLGTGCGFSGCDAVLGSQYASVYGVSLAALGFGFYGVLLLLASVGYFKLMTRLLGVAVIVIIGLLGIQGLIIKSWCLYCLVSSAVMVLMLGIASRLKDVENVSISTAFRITIVVVFSLGLFVEAIVTQSVASTRYALKVDGRYFSLSDIDAYLGLSGAELDQQKNDLRQKWLRTYLAEKDMTERGISQSELYAELVETYKSNIMEGLSLYEDALFDKYDVDVKFPVPSIVEIQDNRYGAIGATEVKPFHIVEFIDLQCGHCRSIHFEIKDLKERYSEQISVEIRHFPLGSHSHSKQAAQLAWCMNNQQLGDDYIDAVFNFKGSLTNEILVDLAVQSGADRTAVLTCIADPVSFEAIQEDISIARDLGVTGTPAVFLNNRFVRSVSDIEKAVNNAR